VKISIQDSGIEEQDLKEQKKKISDVFKENDIKENHKISEN